MRKLRMYLNGLYDLSALVAMLIFIVAGCGLDGPDWIQCVKLIAGSVVWIAVYLFSARYYYWSNDILLEDLARIVKKCRRLGRMIFRRRKEHGRHT